MRTLERKSILRQGPLKTQVPIEPAAAGGMSWCRSCTWLWVCALLQGWAGLEDSSELFPDGD